MSTQLSAPVAAPPAAGAGRTSWRVEHRPFLVALGVAVLLRVLVQAAFMPAFVFSDGPTYLSLVDDLTPSPERPVGYVVLVLRPLSLLSNHVLWVAVAQHLLGLVTAAVLYALLRRCGVGRRVAMLATLPVLFDYLQLNLEHDVLSDVLFELLVVVGFAILFWRRRITPATAAVAGLVLGTSVTVRLVGEPLVASAVLACLMATASWRTRLTAAVMAALGFALPVAAYTGWYHQHHGVYALSEFGGTSLYGRTTSFVDCGRLSVPAYQRVLCPAEPLGQRQDPTYYTFHDLRTLPRLHPPAGTTQDQALRSFALAAIRTQPLDYARVAMRDFWMNFDMERANRFEYDTANKWGFERYLHLEPTGWTWPAYQAHGGDQLDADGPLAGAVARYTRVGSLPGPLLLGCLALGLAAGLGLGAARRSVQRAPALVLALTGAGLLLVPDLTAEFTWRYQLTALALLPAAAALGYTAFRTGQRPDGTVATASTDWPNGGRTSPSMTRVAGTTRRS